MVQQPTVNEKIRAIQLALLDNPADFALWQELKGAVETSKAVWTARYVNDLPDMAFALILPGGELDEMDRTTPRSLRKLPHHIGVVADPAEDDSVDWPHLLNALARVSQIEGATAEELATAEEHLRWHFNRINEAEGGDETEEVQE
ncbi:MAG: hypothetical protein Q7U75_19440 [Desulfobacterales bacterium]|nr:hypothetical protein [Desulfobacterales bacterium]